MKPLWPFQERGVEEIIQYACDNISGRLLVVGPPGCGKTRIIAEVLRLMAAEQGMRGLAWAHRRELVGQLTDTLVENGIPQDLVGITMARDPRYNPDALINVASVDTLRRRDKPPADIVVSDEAHRDASEGRRRMRELYPDALHIGFTATPIGANGRSLQGAYDKMIIIAQPSELIADGYLAAPKIYTVPPELLPDIRRVRRKGADLDPVELERASNRHSLVGSIVEHWLRLAEGRRTLIFPVGIRHSKAIVARFKTAGVAAAHIDCDTPPRARRDIIKALILGQVPVVSSCDVFSEGIDIPPVKCVVLARRTVSLRLLIQWGGRAMRPWEGVEPIILDHAGNVLLQGHGAPHADRAWSLDDSAAARSGWSKTPVMKRCDRCGLVVPGGKKECPGCMAVFTIAEPPETTHALLEYRQKFTAEQKTREYERLCAFAEERGIPEDWAGRVYRAKFGEAPAVC